MEMTPKPPNQITKVFAFSILAFGLVIFAADYINLRSSVSRHLRDDVGTIANNDNDTPKTTNDTPKPIMTTFFEPVEGGCCGMTQQGHDNLVASWRAAWELYGWETRILTEADAQKHPRFNLLQQRLIEAKVNEYDRRCFWRWLAMAHDGNPLGGWMSDYDLFPLTLTGNKGLELMSTPGFKSYGCQVPALIHADQSSWEHIIQMMTDLLSPDLDIEFISDMMLLRYLHQHYTEEEMRVTYWEFDLWKTFPYKRLPGKEDPVIDCNVVASHLAAHLSHRGVQEAHEVSHTYPKIEEEIKKWEYTEYRAQAADVMMKDLGQCVGNTVE
jgi:hypothetical protein